MAFVVTPYRWIASGGGNWNVAANWDFGGTNQVPGAGAVVELTGAGSPTVTYDTSGVVYQSVTVESTGIWALPGDPIFTLAQPSGAGNAFDTGSLTLGDTATHAGAYGQDSGSLTVTGTALIGNAGIGMLTISGGTATIGQLVLGSSNGSQGTVSLTGGTLNDDAIVGDAGTGIFTNTGAADDVSGQLILGNQSTGDGTYTVTGDAAQTDVGFVSGGNGCNPNGALIVGNQGAGSFTQGLADQSDTGNQVSVAGDLTLGQGADAVGTYTLNTGTLTVGGQLAVGGTSTNDNLFTQNGGSVILDSSASGNPDYVNVGSPAFNPWIGALSVGGGVGNGDGSNSGGNGAYDLNGGTIDTYNLLIGAYGTGTMTQAAGAVTTTYFTAGFTGTGTYNLQDGTFDAYGEGVASYGTGYFNQSGGTNSVTTTIFIGYNGGSIGTYTLSAGTLTVGGVDQPGLGPTGQDAGIAAVLGFDGNGTVDQIAGSATFGTAQLSDGTPGTEGDLVIGLNGQGTYTLGDASAQAPSLTVYGSVILGQSAGSNADTTPSPDDAISAVDPNLVIQGDGSNLGIYYNNGNNGNDPPNPQSSNLIVGLDGNGAVTQTDQSTVYTDGSIVVGGNQGGVGSYTLAADDVGGSLVNLSVGTDLNIGGITDIPNGAVGYFQPFPWTPGGVGVFNLDSGTLHAYGALHLANNGGTGSFNQIGGTASFVGGMYIGDADYIGGAVGTYNQSGGSVVSSSLWLGYSGTNPNPRGYYDLTGTGSLTINGAEIVGELGYGDFTQGDGNGTTIQTVNGTQIVGDGALITGDSQGFQREGLYNLMDGSLTTDGTIVGNQGLGIFTQTGGTNTIDGTLALGSQTTPVVSIGPGVTVGGVSSGTYDLSGGVLATTGALTVGDAGSGVLDQTGGSLQVAQSNGPNVDMIVGAQAGGAGGYSLSGGGLATVNGNLLIGRDGLSESAPAATGTVTVGTVGATADATSLTVTDTLVVGSGGTGMFTQYSGAVTAGNVSIGGGGGVDGGGIYPDGGTGTYTLIDGTLTASLIEVGHAGEGIFAQSGGTVTDNWALWLGNASFSDGTYDLSGGQLNVSYGGEQVGLFGNGIFTQTGGANTIGGGGGLQIGAYATGSYTITGNDSSLTMDGNVDIGVSSNTNGSLTIGDGTDSPTVSVGDLTVGDAGTGTLTLNSGSLTAGVVGVGINGSGTVVQNGGSFTATYLDLSTPAGGGDSSFTMAGGSFEVFDLNVGGGTTGTAAFTQSGGTVTAGGTLFVSNVNTTSPGSSSYTMTGGTLLVDFDAFIGDETYGTGGAAFSESGGASVTISGELTIGNPVGVSAASFTLGGISTLSAGSGIALGAYGILTGAGTVSGGGIDDDGMLSASGGTLTIDNSLTGLGGLAIGANAALGLFGSVASTLSLDFGAAGSDGTLQLGTALIATPLAMDAAIVDFFSGDTIRFGIGAPVSYGFDGTHLNFLDGSTRVASLTFGGSYSLADFNVVETSNTVTVTTTVPCFLAGTHILTTRGELPVEALRAGDRVLTRDGASRPVRWIGERRIDALAHPRPDRVQPIRIRRGAFAEQVPHRDLLVSPDHAIFVDGRLIPARLLVNDVTILQDRSIRQVHYFHVELDRHDVILAEGLAAESYLDTGNRAMFANAGLALLLHPAFAINAGLKAWRTDACAELTVDADTVEPIWQRLADRAGPAGWVATTTTDPGLCLLMDGQLFAPVAVEGGRHVFAVPRGGAARLVSRSARPSDARPWLDDGRLLGVAVRHIVCRDEGGELHIPPDHPAMRDGWWAAERAGTAIWRWTDGSGALDLPAGTEIVEVTLHAGMTYLLADVKPGRLAA